MKALDILLLPPPPSKISSLVFEGCRKSRQGARVGVSLLLYASVMDALALPPQVNCSLLTAHLVLSHTTGV